MMDGDMVTGNDEVIMMMDVKDALIWGLRWWAAFPRPSYAHASKAPEGG